jgi:hyperosmotically inducible protein
MYSDIELRRDVYEELNNESGVDASLVAASVHEGVVTLYGQVSSLSDKLAARRAAGRVLGVRTVIDEVFVVLPQGDKRCDRDLAKACQRALRQNRDIPDGIVEVDVEGGRVLLRGELSTREQCASAVSSVQSVCGLLGLNDETLVWKRFDREHKCDQRFENHRRRAGDRTCPQMSH